MLLKIFGIADLFSALIFWTFANFQIFPQVLVLSVGFYLLVKGLVFLASGGVANILDILAAAVIFLSLITNIHWIVAFVIALYLIQKAILSFIA